MVFFLLDITGAFRNGWKQIQTTRKEWSRKTEPGLTLSLGWLREVNVLERPNLLWISQFFVAGLRTSLHVKKNLCIIPTCIFRSQTRGSIEVLVYALSAPLTTLPRSIRTSFLPAIYPWLLWCVITEWLQWITPSRISVPVQSPPMPTRSGHLTGFGQWDIRTYNASRDLKSPLCWGLSLRMPILRGEAQAILLETEEPSWSQHQMLQTWVRPSQNLQSLVSSQMTAPSCTMSGETYRRITQLTLAQSANCKSWANKRVLLSD